MGIQISEQCLTFLYAIILGFCLGLLYEILRFLRLCFFHRAWLIAIEDFFFCMTCTFFIILLCYVYAEGVIRWFTLVGCLLGTLAYFFSLGKWLHKLTEHVVGACKRLFSKIYHTLVAPIARSFSICLSRVLQHFEKELDQQRRAKLLRYHRKTKRRILKLTKTLK